jgi:hypothetical protein
MMALRHEKTMNSHFSVDSILHHDGFCDDFGPMSLGMTYEFFNIMEKQFNDHPDKLIVLSSDIQSRVLSIFVCLIGSYMTMKLELTPDAIVDAFKPAREFLVSYRDVSPGEQSFHLFLHDGCARLWRAKALGWLRPAFQGFDAD